MAELHISSQAVAGVPTVYLTGELDSYSAPRVRTLLEGLAAESHPCVRVHMGGLDYIDSTGLGMLVAALKQATDHEGQMELIAPTPAVVRVLHITGLDKIFCISAEAPLIG